MGVACMLWVDVRQGKVEAPMEAQQAAGVHTPGAQVWPEAQVHPRSATLHSHRGGGYSHVSTDLQPQRRSTAAPPVAPTQPTQPNQPSSLPRPQISAMASRLPEVKAA